METSILQANVNTCKTALSNLLLQPDAVISVSDEHVISDDNAPSLWFQEPNTGRTKTRLIQISYLSYCVNGKKKYKEL
jgi:hypothetical protein